MELLNTCYRKTGRKINCGKVVIVDLTNRIIVSFSVQWPDGAEIFLKLKFQYFFSFSMKVVLTATQLSFVIGPSDIKSSRLIPAFYNYLNVLIRKLAKTPSGMLGLECASYAPGSSNCFPAFQPQKFQYDPERSKSRIILTIIEN